MEPKQMGEAYEDKPRWLTRGVKKWPNSLFVAASAARLSQQSQEESFYL